MELRRYFTQKIWWGKMIGAFFGFLIAGPLGALFGLLIGSFFDNGLVDHFSNPFWHFNNESDQEVKNTFFEALFMLLGHISKSNGRVSQIDISCANNVMTSMRLSTRQKKLAQKYFNQGKEKEFNLYITLYKLQKAINDKPNLIRLFIDTEYNFIKQTGATIEKLDILNNILSSLGMAPIQRQAGFENVYQWYNTRQRTDQQQSRQQHQSSYQSKHDWQNSNNTAENNYEILGLTSTATKEQVKRAYRKLISCNHPDKLIAKGASEREIKAANEKTSQISNAYEQICKSRGW
jgi:DnaJ like chaperone protein